jgi:hypothetical protein
MVMPEVLPCLDRVQEIVQEHLSFEPGEVLLHDAALVQWAAALIVHHAACLSTCGIATVALQMGYVTGLGKDAQAVAPSAKRKPYSISIDKRWVLSLIFRHRLPTRQLLLVKNSSICGGVGVSVGIDMVMVKGLV